MSLDDLVSLARSGRPATVPQFCEATGYSRSATYQAMRRGELKVMRLGAAIRIPGAEVLRVVGADVGKEAA